MTPWDRATLALQLLAIDPKGLGGLVVRARMSPARDALMSAVSGLSLPLVKLHPNLDPQTLNGDIDLTATLRGNTLVAQKGLLDREPSLFVMPMAERVEPYLSARLAQAFDADTGHVFLALDEGVDEDETLPASLWDRAAFRVSLDGLALADIAPIVMPDDAARLAHTAREVTVSDEITEQLVALAVQLGIFSLRAPSFALRAAQAHAALHGRIAVDEMDITVAVDLVYAHRATQLPEVEDPEPPMPENEQDDTPPEESETTQTLPQDILLDAVKAALPPDLLEKLTAGQPNKRSKGSGSGAKRTGNRRGRPLPPRSGSKASGARVDLVATLRAAIPWQTIRKQAWPGRNGPIIHSSDLRFKRYQNLSDRLLIFTVDASGSAAMARLAEAKGAVELLLAEAYARRDHVALISFRGVEADLLLPPTRSLVQTKRRLAAIPGGGATPLASGLTQAMALAETARQKGLTPTIVLLTDGRSNIALNGDADRVQAKEDAQRVATQIAVNGVDGIVIDTTARPEPSLAQLSKSMGATYVPLPRANAQGMSSAVTAALAG